MKATIDQAGRVVIPKSLRDRLGLKPGLVEIREEGAGIRIEAVVDDALEERDGLLVIPASGASIDDDLVRALRDELQR